MLSICLALLRRPAVQFASKASICAANFSSTNLSCPGSTLSSKDSSGSFARQCGCRWKFDAGLTPACCGKFGGTIEHSQWDGMKADAAVWPHRARNSRRLDGGERRRCCGSFFPSRLRTVPPDLRCGRPKSNSRALSESRYGEKRCECTQAPAIYNGEPLEALACG